LVTSSFVYPATVHKMAQSESCQQCFKYQGIVIPWCVGVMMEEVYSAVAIGYIAQLLLIDPTVGSLMSKNTV